MNRRVGAVAAVTMAVVFSVGVTGCGDAGSGGLLGGLVGGKAECDTYVGPNPTPAELQAARRGATEGLYRVMERAGVPTGPADGKQSFIDLNSTVFSEEVDLALAAAPPGSVQAYTEYLCDPPVAPDSPEAKQLLGDMSDKLEQFKSNPELADVDWDAAVAQMKDVNRQYAVNQAVMPLILCGTAIKAGEPVDASSLQQAQLSADMQTWALEGFRLLCPDQVPAATAAGDPAASGGGVQDCGPMPTGSGLHVINEATNLSCADATDLMTRYLDHPRTQAGDRGLQMDEWQCGILGAVRAEELGYAVVCETDSGKVTLQQPN